MKIWVTHGFSLRTLAAEMVRARPGVEFLFSAPDPHAAVRDVAPSFVLEPPALADDHAAWVLKTAIDHRADSIVAQRGRSRIVAAGESFGNHGVAIHVAAAPEVIALLDDKAAFTAALAGDPLACPTAHVGDVRECRDAIARITADGATACVKPTRGLYGAGYWTLDARDPFHHLRDPDARRISPDAFLQSLEAAEASGATIDLLVMEHLPGTEVSVDIVACQGETLLAGVREKLASARQRIRTDHVLLDHARMLVRRHALHGANNIQYKLDRTGAWKVLEINTRAAGGAPYCDAVGIPFAATWVDVITGDARPFTGRVDCEIVAVTRAEPRARRPS